jgi:hypothetical protein
LGNFWDSHHEKKTFDSKRHAIQEKDTQFRRMSTSKDGALRKAALQKLFTKRGSRKKEQGVSPARKIVSTLFARNLDLIFVGGATLLVRARAPPETWTTRRWSHDLPAPIFVDQIFALVIIFGNECSKLEQFTK